MKQSWEDDKILDSFNDPEGRTYVPGILIDDDLTRTTCKLLEIRTDGYNVGFKIDNDHLGGLRHPWEICISGKPWGPGPSGYDGVGMNDGDD